MCTDRLWPRRRTSPRTRARVSSSSSGQRKASRESIILPLSMRPISSISSMSPSSSFPDRAMVSRHSAMRLGSFRLLLAMVVMPIMAFIGVRISWDILARNRDLA